jgi:hypothetical protein
VFDLLELVEFLPDVLEIAGTTRNYRERQAAAEARLESFARLTLAEHRARRAANPPSIQIQLANKPA